MFLTQYFKILLSSPKVSPGEKPTQKDVTSYVKDGLNLMDEDGKIRELSFTLSEGPLIRCSSKRRSPPPHSGQAPSSGLRSRSR
jgi:hypothetical protein